jgi:transposase
MESNSRQACPSARRSATGGRICRYLQPSGQIRHQLVVHDGLAPLIAEAETELFRLSQQEPWRDQVVFLVQLPGIQVLTAMVLLAAIGDINRFPKDRFLVGYAGLGTKVHDSGETRRQGHITKRGRRELRTTMVEAAWSAVRWHPFWKAEFKRLVEVKHLNPKVAAIAIARRLLVVVWHVLSKREADRQAIPDGVARKFMVWAYRVRQTGRAAKTSTFVRAELSKLGLPTPSTVQLGSHVLNFAISSP